MKWRDLIRNVPFLELFGDGAELCRFVAGTGFGIGIRLC